MIQVAVKLLLCLAKHLATNSYGGLDE